MAKLVMSPEAKADLKEIAGYLINTVSTNNRTVDGNSFPLRGRHCICEFGGLFLS